MISSSHTITTTPTQLLTASGSWRTVYLHIVGNGTVLLGGANLTAANGLATVKHTAPLELYIPAEEELWAMVATGTETLQILGPALYAE